MVSFWLEWDFLKHDQFPSLYVVRRIPVGVSGTGSPVLRGESPIVVQHLHGGRDLWKA